jgi:hypothetical protein
MNFTLVGSAAAVDRCMQMQAGLHVEEFNDGAGASRWPCLLIEASIDQAGEEEEVSVLDKLNS